MRALTHRSSRSPRPRDPVGLDAGLHRGGGGVTNFILPDGVVLGLEIGVVMTGSAASDRIARGDTLRLAVPLAPRP